MRSAYFFKYGITLTCRVMRCWWWCAYRLSGVLLSDLLCFQDIEAYRRALLRAVLRARRHHHHAHQDQTHARHSCQYQHSVFPIRKNHNCTKFLPFPPLFLFPFPASSLPFSYPFSFLPPPFPFHFLFFSLSSPLALSFSSPSLPFPLPFLSLPLAFSALTLGRTVCSVGACLAAPPPRVISAG